MFQNSVMRADRENKELITLIVKLVEHGPEALSTPQLETIEKGLMLFSRTIRAFLHEIYLVPEILKERRRAEEKQAVKP